MLLLKKIFSEKSRPAQVPRFHPSHELLVPTAWRTAFLLLRYGYVVQGSRQDLS
jgi:hypothetical protein